MYSATGIGPAERDAPADFGFERRGALALPAPQRRLFHRVDDEDRRRRATAAPTADWPMVAPPHRKPSCASGSRKNSQNVRAIA